jgi:hypothetical protein
MMFINRGPLDLAASEAKTATPTLRLLGKVESMFPNACPKVFQAREATD